jgi:hypothetical protein
MLLATLLASSCSAAGNEPPTQLRVEIDGKPYVTTAGASIDADLGGRIVKLRVEELPWRRFAQAGLQFDYPRHFPWDSDPSPPRSWTLDGNDAVIMVFDNTLAKRKAEDLAGDIEKAIARGAHIERSKAVLRTDKAGILTGVVSTMEVAGSPFSNEVFVLGKGEVSWLLVLQDALGDDGTHSSEYIEMRKRLSATLEF